MNRTMRGYISTAGLMACGVLSCQANPTGGQIASGSASISSAPGTVTVTQTSNIAIINWQTFSIGAGELTKFIQPSAASAALNRVLGGQTSVINGTLEANGQVYLINGNGIVIGPGGVISANAFTASTRDISDLDFLAGHQHFTGSSSAGVENEGTITALGGNVYLLGKTVSNSGTINAANGTVGLAAGDDILLAQKNADGSTLTVKPDVTATAASGQTGVSNSGTIAATNAELKAANGNLYALAINNSGTIRATTVKHEGGRILLTSDSGTVINSGLLSASAAAAKGKGGTVVIKSEAGVAIHSGQIVATGGQGGVGGNAEVSGGVIQATGKVDLTAPGGRMGTLTFDPYNVIVSNGGTTAIISQGGITGDTSNSVLNVNDLETDLASASVVIFTGIAGSAGSDVGNITISVPVSWSTTSDLILSAAGNVYLNASITAPLGGLSFNTHFVTSSLSNGALNPAGVTGNITVGTFSFVSGDFIQNSTSLPTFSATSFSDFDGTFLRSQGGAGTRNNPYVIVDTYGDQGLDTLPSSTYFVYGNGFVGTHTPNGNTGGGGSGTGTTTLPEILNQPAVAQQISSFASYTANPPVPPVLPVNFTPMPGGGALVAFNDTEGGGAVNHGSSKKGTNIASGSSVVGGPTPNALLTAESGIAAMVGGMVNAAKPPAFIIQKIEQILNQTSEDELNAAAFGKP